MATFSLPQSRRAETRLSVGFVLGSKILIAPHSGKSCVGSSGTGGWKLDASAFFSHAAVLSDNFEHPSFT